MSSPTTATTATSATTLFIRGLPLNTDEQALSAFIAQYAPDVSVSKVTILREQNGVSKGYGYVVFNSTEAAGKALMLLDKKTLGANVISVHQYNSRVDECNISIKNIPQISKKELSDIFSKFGRIDFIRFDEGQNNANITFETVEAATNAVKEMNNFKINDVPIFVTKRFDLKTKDNQPSGSGVSEFPNTSSPNTVVAKFFPPFVTEEMLKEKLSVFGTIKSCVIKQLRHRIAFITFSSQEEVQKALHGFTVIQFNSRTLYLEPYGQPFSFAPPQPQMIYNQKPRQYQQPQQQQRQYIRPAQMQQRPQQYQQQQQQQYQQQQQQQQQQQLQQQLARPTPIQPLSTEEMKMNDEELREAIGERIYNYVADVHGTDVAGKVTGMVLQLYSNGFGQLNAFLADGQIYNKIEEALTTLKNTQK